VQALPCPSSAAGALSPSYTRHKVFLACHLGPVPGVPNVVFRFGMTAHVPNWIVLTTIKWIQGWKKVPPLTLYVLVFWAFHQFPCSLWWAIDADGVFRLWRLFPILTFPYRCSNSDWWIWILWLPLMQTFIPCGLYSDTNCLPEGLFQTEILFLQQGFYLGSEESFGGVSPAISSPAERESIYSADEDFPWGIPGEDSNAVIQPSCSLPPHWAVCFPCAKIVPPAVIFQVALSNGRVCNLFGVCIDKGTS